MRKAIYPGTFDPVTVGHEDVMRRAAHVFDHLIVAVAESHNKQTWFSHAERVALVREAVADLKNVTVVPFDGLLVNFARAQGVGVLVRGLRAFSDFEYEFQMALTNRKLAPDLETVFLMPKEKYSAVSSRFVREIGNMGGNLSDLVPEMLRPQIARHLRK